MGSKKIEKGAELRKKDSKWLQMMPRWGGNRGQEDNPKKRPDEGGGARGGKPWYERLTARFRGKRKWAWIEKSAANLKCRSADWR